jgi:hypothetical protein
VSASIADSFASRFFEQPFVVVIQDGHHVVKLVIISAPEIYRLAPGVDIRGSACDPRGVTDRQCAGQLLFERVGGILSAFLARLPPAEHGRIFQFIATLVKPRFWNRKLGRDWRLRFYRNGRKRFARVRLSNWFQVGSMLVPIPYMHVRNI